jgi:hypothetical protein
VKRPDHPRPPSPVEAVIPVASLILLVGLSYFLLGDAGAMGPNQVALVIATVIAGFVGWRCGHSLESLGKAATDSVSTGIGAIFILFAVGGLIGTWALSGTLVAMVYYGLQLLSPKYREDSDRRLIETTFAGEAGHAESWVMFTPTELLKQYVKEAFNQEGIAAPDSRIKT